MSWILRLFKNHGTAAEPKLAVESQPRPTTAAPVREPESAVAAAADRLPIGWTTGSMLSVAGAGEPQTWVVDHGYQFVFVLMPLAGVADGVIEFDAADAALHLDYGGTIQPIGLAVCLDADFRGRVGQKVPGFLSTSRVTIRQQSGSCYAHVYALQQHVAPQSVERGGRFVALSPKDGDGKPGGPQRMHVEVKPKATLRDHVPFAHIESSHRGFVVCEHFTPGRGILAVGSFKDMSVIVARMGTRLVADGAVVRSHDISARLRDGSSVKALGMVVQMRGPHAAPIAWGDKLEASPRSTRLERGGTMTAMPQYDGPYSAISEVDCKIAAVFPAQVQLKHLLEIAVGTERAGLGDAVVLRPPLEAEGLVAELAVQGDIDALVAVVRDPDSHAGVRARLTADLQWQSAWEEAEKGFRGQLNHVPDLNAIARQLVHGCRRTASSALGEARSSLAVLPLIAALSDHDRHAREFAIRSLHRIGDHRALTPIIATLRDSEPDVRKCAAQALGDFRDPAAVKPLAALLKDKMGEVRRCAAEMLGRFEGLARIAELDRALQDGDVFVAAGAYRYVLEKLRPGDEKVLTRALREHGSDSMAQSFLDSGQAGLIAAATEWNKTHRWRDIAILD